MWKIHVTRQFFEASGRHGDFFEKTKNLFLDKVNGSMVPQSRRGNFNLKSNSEILNYKCAKNDIKNLIVQFSF